MRALAGLMVEILKIPEVFVMAFFVTVAVIVSGVTWGVVAIRRRRR